jgi:hypothetical protein
VDKEAAMKARAIIIIATLAMATSAKAMIGQTPDQVIQGARRDKNTLHIEAAPYGDRSAIQVYYRDSAEINHVFGSNGREIGWFLTAPGRLTSEEVFAMQRMYKTRWEGAGILNGVSSYQSESNLYMGVSRNEKFDFVTILDQANMFEIAQALVKERDTNAAAAPSSTPNDCMIVATEAYTRLKRTSYWVQMAGIKFIENGQDKGHPIVFYQPTANSNVFMYDASGSYDLHTKSHDLERLTPVLDSLLKKPARVQSLEWIES